jgi:hypothetical protein
MVWGERSGLQVGAIVCGFVRGLPRVVCWNAGAPASAYPFTAVNQEHRYNRDIRLWLNHLSIVVPGVAITGYAKTGFILSSDFFIVLQVSEYGVVVCMENTTSDWLKFCENVTSTCSVFPALRTGAKLTTGG